MNALSIFLNGTIFQTTPPFILHHFRHLTNGPKFHVSSLC
jgi:hypothetical protein